MSTLSVIDAAGKHVGEYEVNEAWLERERGEQAVHDLVVAIQAAKRAGTASTKTRAEVRGGGSKPWRQKGTGRARAGSIRSPLWRGGGTIFGPKPRNYHKKVNKKVRRLALRRAFTECLDAEKFVVVDRLEIAEPKTRLVKELIQATLGDARRPLILLPDDSKGNLKQAGGNIDRAEVIPVHSVNVYQLLLHDKILISREGLDALGGRMA